MTSSLIYNRAARLSRRYTSEMRESSRLSLAFVSGNIAHVIIATTDVIMAGWISTEALAASTLAQGLYYLLFLLFSGLLISTIPFITDALGSKAKKRTICICIDQLHSAHSSCIFNMLSNALFYERNISFFWPGSAFVSRSSEIHE